MIFNNQTHIFNFTTKTCFPSKKCDHKSKFIRVGADLLIMTKKKIHNLHQ